ncbi:Ig-like domain-containing protein [Aeromonas veronii]
MRSFDVFFRLLGFFVCAVFLTACGDGNGSDSPSRPELSTLERIDIVASPVVTKGTSALMLAKGNRQPFIATGHYSDGSAQEITSSVAWTTSTPMAAIISSAGLLLGIDVGSTTVTANKNGITSNPITVTVTDATIIAIQVTSASASVARGQTQQLTATATYSDYTSADISDTVDWFPVDATTASVTPAGLLTGIESGATTVTAGQDGITSNPVTVTVTGAVMTSIQVTPDPISVANGQTQQLTATATYSDNTHGDISKSVTWWLGSALVTPASVTPAGLLTGIESGVTTVIASQDGITSNPVTATVTGAVVTSIDASIRNIADVIPLGENHQLSAIATYSDNTRGDISNDVSWLIADAAIATVTPTGMLRGIKKGSTTFTASFSGITSTPFSFVVGDASITDIQVTPNPISVANGQTQQLTATATYSDNTHGDISNDVSWSSADVSIATVTPTGLLMGIKLGGTTTVKASRDTIESNSVSVMVGHPSLIVPGVGEFSIPVVPSSLNMNFSDAVSYCSNFSIDGKAWRVPTADELTALGAAHLDEMNKNWKTDVYYWSSTDTNDPSFPGFKLGAYFLISTPDDICFDPRSPIERDGVTCIR